MYHQRDVEANDPLHPSQSIHNAAYPDTPYRPGTGTSNHANNVATGQTYHIHPSQAASTSPSSWQHSNDAADPPPPYDPSTAPPSTSTPSTAPPHRPSLTPHTTSQSGRVSSDAIPLSNLLSLSTHSYFAPSGQDLSRTQSNNQHHETAFVAGATSPSGRYSAQSGKYGPLGAGMMRSRERRARRIKLMILAAVLGGAFFIALIVGLKYRRSNDSDY